MPSKIRCLLLVVTLLGVFALFYSIRDVVHEVSLPKNGESEVTKEFEGVGERESDHEILKTCVNSAGYILATINETLNETFAGLNCSCILSNSMPPEVCSVLYRNWVFNSFLAKQYRDLLNEATRNNTGFILTKKKFVSKLSLRSKFNVFLPEVSPLKGKLFNKCSVVGSSGILRNSFCGEEIDKADFVFRCNVPPISAFKVDAGQKANLTTLNPRGVITDRYNGISQNSDKRLFLRDMKDYQNSYFWIPSHDPSSLKSIYNVMLLLSHTNIGVTIGSLRHFENVKRYWKRRFSSNPTSGIYLLSIALSVCRETHAFGFWPFYEGINGTKIKYHYYDNLYRDYKVSRHNFVAELKTLIELHQEGAIKLHLDKCSSKS